MELNKKTHRLIASCLLLNNAFGIVSNLLLTMISVWIYGIGIPGIVFFLAYFNWVFYPRRRNMVILISMILYNAIILMLVLGEGDAYNHKMFTIFYPYLPPIINIILCLFLVCESIVNPTDKNLLSGAELKPEKKHSVQSGNSYLIISIIVLVSSLLITSFYLIVIL
jgi:hypothetical protein